MPAKMCTSKGRWELFRNTERAKDAMLEADLNLERWLTVHQVRKLFTPTVGYNASGRGPALLKLDSRRWTTPCCRRVESQCPKPAVL